ncbi:hypothetical protein [Clostridium sp. D33t1_170424_F3]|uniref:hypothetical protein n=1 Tax=Clostridium sp. D33t1_170424_F3 TaxID=2787099 RepID=UPI0018AB354C|nr:hypothetical protein [Clostridium sp. D33t1_170424_F3]MDC0700742.1 hypothetical protein [Blautia wexlerae]
MLKKLNKASIAAYLHVAEFFRKLKEDERGVDGIVVAVLLVLVAVLAVVALWGSMSGWLEDMWGNITSEASKIGP